MLRAFKGITPRLATGAWVDDSAVVIGDVHLGENVSIWPTAVVRGDVNRIDIGARTNLQDATVVHVTHDGPYSPGGIATHVGADVTIGHRVIVHACTIGDRVLVGMGATIMDGAVVEDDVIVGAGALVAPGKRLATGYLYLGSPARAIRPLDDSERQHLLYSAEQYVQLKEQHEAGH